MPLLAQDEFGRIYQTDGTRSDGGGLGYYPSMGDDDNVAVGEYPDIARKRRAMNRQKKLQMRKKLARMKQIQMQKLKARQAKEWQSQFKILKQRQAQQIKRNNQKSDLQMKAIKSGKNPFNDRLKALTGDPLIGFKGGGHYLNKKQLQSAKLDMKNIHTAKPFGVYQTAEAHYQEQMGYDHEHSLNGNCCNEPTLGEAQAIVNQSFAHPLLMVNYQMGYYGEETMGFRKAFRKLKRAVKKIAPRAVVKATRKVTKVAGKVMNVMNPIKGVARVAKAIPGVRDVYKGLDKLTGGTLTSVERVSNLPAKAVSGQKISKAELLEGAMLVVKVGAVAVSGGSAVALIGAASGALKNGPLGKTSFGRTILSIGEVAGLAYGAGQGISTALQNKAKDVAQTKLSTEVAKKAGPLGAIAASAAVAAGAAGASGTSTPGTKIPAGATKIGTLATAKAAQDASKNALKELQKSGMKFSTDAALKEAQKVVTEQAKAHVANEFKKKTGIPLDLATDVAQGKIPTTTQIKAKFEKELRDNVDKIKNDLARIPEQIKNADVIQARILKEKEKLFSNELLRRETAMKVVEKKAAEEVIKVNLQLKAKAEAYEKELQNLQSLASVAKNARAKAEQAGANFEAGIDWGAQADKLEREIIAKKDALKPQEEEIVKLSLEAELVKQDGGARLAIAEHGGKTIYTEGMKTEDTVEQVYGDLRHPMLTYGYVGDINA